ncbi:MAG: tripartite tricarboxylate transporter TctB family protein [Desulfovibrio sp.]|nr:tripartite tricarboxylate transporter TctB family protein [Desulfovibrio sp.]
MTRSDVGVIAMIYATCLLFFFMTLNLKPAAQIYPMCLIAGLALLNTFYFVRCLARLWRTSPRVVANDLPTLFAGFLPTQFFFVLGACVAYLGLLYCVGFYLAGFVYLLGVLLWFKVKIAYIITVIAVLGCLVYGVFTLFLKVPLPTGVLFG